MNLIFLEPIDRYAFNYSDFHFTVMTEKVPTFMGGEERTSWMHTRHSVVLGHTHSKHVIFSEAVSFLFSGDNNNKQQYLLIARYQG